MTISFVSAAADSIGAHAVGDLILVFASNTSTTTHPGVGPGFIDLGSHDNGVKYARRYAYRIAESNSETLGTWPNGGYVQVGVYRATEPWHPPTIALAVSGAYPNLANPGGLSNWFVRSAISTSGSWAGAWTSRTPFGYDSNGSVVGDANSVGSSPTINNLGCTVGIADGFSATVASDLLAMM